MLEDLSGDSSEETLELTAEVLRKLLGSTPGWKDIPVQETELETRIISKFLRVVKKAGNSSMSWRKSGSRNGDGFSAMLPFSGIHRTATTNPPSNLCKFFHLLANNCKELQYNKKIRWMRHGNK